MPEFQGGNKALIKFISDNLKYDSIAMCYNGVEGRVTLKFLIHEDGSVSDIVVVRSLDPALDKEAIRIVRLMPKWIPGKQNGELCTVWYNLPIQFRRQ
jgi:protein TonB